MTQSERARIGTVMPVIGDSTPVRYANVERQLYVFAASEDMPRVHHWQLAQGRYYTAAEDRDMAPLAVLGHKVSEQFFPDTPSLLGRHLLIGNVPFEVIGVMAERGADSGAQNYDDMVFIPYQAGRARVYRAQTQPDYTVVATASVAQMQAAEQAMRALLLQRHGREDFAIGNPAAKLQAEAQTCNAMTLIIGIRMATGARQGDILRQFPTEAVLVTLVGGASGVAMGLRWWGPHRGAHRHPAGGAGCASAWHWGGRCLPAPAKARHPGESEHGVTHLSPTAVGRAAQPQNADPAFEAMHCPTAFLPSPKDGFGPFALDISVRTERVKASRSASTRSS